jgi:HPt (histidine-containing phosphotransfer) domain-containing protein
MSILLIDLDSGANLHGDRASAETLLRLFMQELDSAVSEILHLHASKQLPDLYDKVHSLCGAACYSSTPKLLETLKKLNAALAEAAHNNEKTVPEAATALVSQLEQDYLQTQALFRSEYHTGV